ncbi:HTH domain-containing protein [Asaia sp. VD9]|uniref:helix-turn-helix transcriptional regulator n=1 Tax=Asaia sp. VD9 TaxID=3081235 RepID=UPI0030161357
MSRSERLFDLLHVLRGHRRPVSGKVLAKQVGVSIRTLYRDIVSLQALGAVIEGEPGVGYVLKPGFLLPPPHVHAGGDRGAGARIALGR